MKRCYDYTIVPTVEGVPIFVVESTNLKLVSPVLLYDGGSHAVLFADEKSCNEAYKLSLMGKALDFAEQDAILVDYINTEAQELLKKCTWCVFMEKNRLQDEDVVRDYRVVIRHVSKNSMTDDL